LVYALLDGAPMIRAEHLLAALALWEYAEASARYIFGDALGNPVADQILKELRTETDGLTRTEIRDVFGRHGRAPEIDAALRSLSETGMASCEHEQTNGRPVERWHAMVPSATKAT